MLPSIDFSHLYRFLCSLGLVLMALSIILPWFIFQTQDSLLISVKELDNLTPAARETLQLRQTVIASIHHWIPALSITLLMLGLAIFIYSIRKWNDRQKITDDLSDKEQMTRISITQASSTEIAEEESSNALTEPEDELKLREEDIPVTVPATPTEPSHASPHPSTSNGRNLGSDRSSHQFEWREVAKQLKGQALELISKAYTPAYSMIQDAKIEDHISGSRLIIDAVLTPIQGQDEQLLIEVIITRSPLTLIRLVPESMLRLSSAVQLVRLSNSHHTKPKGIVIGIIESSDENYSGTLPPPSATGFERMLRRSHQAAKQTQSVLKEEVGYLALTRASLNSLTAHELRTLIEHSSR